MRSLVCAPIHYDRVLIKRGNVDKEIDSQRKNNVKRHRERAATYKPNRVLEQTLLSQHSEESTLMTC